MSTIDTNSDDPMDHAMAKIYLSKEINVYLKHQDQYKENKMNMFNVIIGQYTDLMVSKLESEILWKQVKSSSDVVGLLTFVRNISFRYESQCYPFKAVRNAMRGFYVTCQQDNMTLEKYMEPFVNYIGI
eukprot:6890351-Ditylum_brightwellii.AAC.1